MLVSVTCRLRPIKIRRYRVDKNRPNSMDTWGVGRWEGGWGQGTGGEVIGTVRYGTGNQVK